MKKEPIEVKKEIKKEVDSPRKTGIEPMFPSVLKRKNAFDDDDGAVFSGQVAPLAPVNVVTEKKIVIKVSLAPLNSMTVVVIGLGIAVDLDGRSLTNPVAAGLTIFRITNSVHATSS